MRIARLTVALTILALPCSLGAQAPGSVAAFWHWFQAHDAALQGMRSADTPMADSLAKALAQVDSLLSFEIGPPDQHPREFYISANGMSSAFPVVLAVTRAAPALAAWRILPFRRPHPGYNTITYAGVSLNADSLWFEAHRRDDLTDLRIYVPGFQKTKDHRWEAAVYLLLDGVIGEYPMETRVGGIAIDPLETPPSATWRRLSALPFTVDTTVP